jgi:RHS repeat-associated protein
LKSISFPKGGEIHYDYKPSTQFFNELGGLANIRPHYPLFVVDKVTKSDFTGRNNTSTYHYSDGYFFFESVNDRELAGFGKVTITDPLNNKVVHYFHQGGGFDGSALGESQDNWALIGQMYRSESFDPQGNLLQRSINTWTTNSLGTKRYFINQQSSTSSTFNNSQLKSTATSYVYDQSNGNLLETLEHGEVTANNDGTFTDIGNDHRKSISTYVKNDSKNIYAFPAEQKLFNASDQLIGQSQTFYDNLPLRRISLGNVTQQNQSFVEESRLISNQSSYNSEGLIISSTDPLGNTSSISYDSLNLFPASITNSLGHQTNIEYDLAFGQATRTVNPNDMESNIILDGLGRVTEQKMIDPNSNNQLITMNKISYNESQFPQSVVNKIFLDDQGTTADYYQYFDGFGRIIQVRAEDDGSPDQYIISNTVYDELGRTTSTSLPIFATGSSFNLNDASSILTTSTYDALSRPLTVTDANGTTSFSYDIWDTTVTDALGKSKSTKSDAFGRLVEVIEQPATDNYSTLYTYDARDLLIQIENANGNIRGIQYDSLGRLVSQEDLHSPSDTDFGVRSYTYDDNGNVLSVTKADGTVLSSTYDTLSRVLTQSGSIVNYAYTYDQGSFGIGQLSSLTGPDHTWSGTYDIRGRLISESTTLDPRLSTEIFTKNFSYTRFDQPSTVSFPDGTNINYSYNKIGQIKDINSSAGGIITHIGYSPLSQVEGVSYGNGLRSVFTYDPNQMYRMVKKRTEPASIPVTFSPLPEFNLGGTLAWNDWMKDFIPSAHALESYYDPDITVPAEGGGGGDGGSGGEGGSGGLESYYDEGISSGSVFDDTDPNGQVFDITRQTRGSRSSREVQNENQDSSGGVISKPIMTHSGALGNPSGNDDLIFFRARYENTMQSAEPAVKYQILVEQNSSPIWDSGKVLMDTPVSAGQESPYIPYDTSALSEGEASWKITFEIQGGVMSPWSDMNMFTVGASTPTAPSVTYLQDIDYIYDAVGNIVSLVEKSGTAASKTAAYVYDDLYRLLTTTVTAATAGEDYVRTQTYGPTGNILTKSDVGSYDYAQLGKTNPQAVTKITNTDGSTMAFEYDANGNLTKETQTNADGTSVLKILTWDELDRIVSIAVTNVAGMLSTVSFVYDQGGRRLSKSVTNSFGSKTTLYPFADYEVTDENKTKVSVSANNMHLATIEKPPASSLQPPAVFFSHTDHLGGGNILTDSDGAQSQTLDYYPFGSIRVDEQYSDFDETKKFTGHEFDDVTGYYYAQARYYHPDIGRFVSEDPLGWRVSEQVSKFSKMPQAFNKYSYTANNPIILIDPNGEAIKFHTDFAASIFTWSGGVQFGIAIGKDISIGAFFDKSIGINIGSPFPSASISAGVEVHPKVESVSDLEGKSVNNNLNIGPIGISTSTSNKEGDLDSFGGSIGTPGLSQTISVSDTSIFILKEGDGIKGAKKPNPFTKKKESTPTNSSPSPVISQKESETLNSSPAPIGWSTNSSPAPSGWSTNSSPAPVGWSANSSQNSNDKSSSVCRPGHC